MPLFKILVRQGITNEEFRKLIPELKLVIKEKDDIVFDEKEDLHIVLNGRVVIRYH
jgi:uncharacterized protein YabE (DUF348 family)